MKKAGIVCDNYKVEKFKKELTAAGFTNFKVNPLTAKKLTSIIVYVEGNQINEVKNICIKVELHFKRSN